MSLQDFSTVLSIVFIFFILRYWQSKEVWVHFVKVTLIVGLLSAKILVGDVLFSIFWALLLIGNFIVLLRLASQNPIESSNVIDSSENILPAQNPDPVDEDIAKFWCKYCATGSKTNIGHCDACGGTFPQQ